MKVLFRRIGLVFLVLIAFGLGYVTHRQGLVPEGVRGRVRVAYSKVRNALFGSNPRDGGEWHPFAGSHRGEPGPAADMGEGDRVQEALDTLGYLGASTPAPAARGVTLYEEGLAQDGLNLYSSGHAPEAFLLDMEGKVLHTWRHDFWSVWPGYSPPEWYRITGQDYWRRVHVYDNGDLLGLHGGIGLVKLNRDSELLWSYGGGSHHDLDVTEEGLIYVLTREEGILPRLHPSKPILEPSLTVLDPDGSLLRRISLLECFENSSYAPLLNRIPEWGDIFHTNTIEVFDGAHADKSPLFSKGRVLISIFTLDTIAIVDLDLRKVVWALSGMWRRQHDPMLLDDGRMLIFDNRGYGGKSQILEFDPFTQEVFWSYRGSAQNPFYTEWCGAVARLPNGNTLITETNNGRAFEVTPEHRVVWEFVNPQRVEEDGVVMIPSLWEVIRLEPEFGADWLRDGRNSEGQSASPSAST